MNQRLEPEAAHQSRLLQKLIANGYAQSTTPWDFVGEVGAIAKLTVYVGNTTQRGLVKLFPTKQDCYEDNNTFTLVPRWQLEQYTSFKHCAVGTPLTATFVIGTRRLPNEKAFVKALRLPNPPSRARLRDSVKLYKAA